jgi:hypothetical protein
VGCSFLSRKAQGSLTQGGSGAMGSFVFRLSPAAKMVLAIGGEGGVAEVSTRICIGIPSD